jgi:hypothetical protein
MDMKAKKTQINDEKEAMNMDKYEALLEEALKVYGIPPQWVFATRVDREKDTVIILTYGGKKLTHKRGEAAKFKLSHVEISGVLPKKETLWSDRLNQGITVDELRKRQIKKGG